MQGFAIQCTSIVVATWLCMASVPSVGSERVSLPASTNSARELESILRGLGEAQGAIRNLTVMMTLVKRQRFSLPVDEPVETNLVAKVIVDDKGRVRDETQGQLVDLDTDEKSVRLLRTRLLGVFRDGERHRLKWIEDRLDRASLDKYLPIHGIDPRELTTHFRGISVADWIRQAGTRIADRVDWDGRAVVVVHTKPFGLRIQRRCCFYIDPERRVVVRRALAIRFHEDLPWREYLRVEGREYHEAAVGIWLPTRVKSECVYVTAELAPEKFGWGIEGVSTDWQVNRELPDETFEVSFPKGVDVTDYRDRPFRPAPVNQGLSVKINPGRIAELATALSESDFPKQVKLLDQVAKMIPRQPGGDDDFVPLLEPLFKLTGWGGIGGERSRFAEELIVRIGPAANPFLDRKLLSSNARERRVAAELLVRIGPHNKALVTFLTELLADRDQFVLGAAIKGLETIGPAAKDAIMELEHIASQAEMMHHRVAARMAIVRIDGAREDQIVKLTEFLSGDPLNVEVAHRAAWNISRLGPQARFVEPQLLDALKHPGLHGSIAATLGDIGADSPATVTALIDILEHGTEREVRRTAAGALGQIGPKAKSAIPGLAAALTEDDQSGWFVAANALGKIGGPEVVPLLIKALENSNADVRLASIRSLGELGIVAEPAIVTLEMSRDQDPRELNRPAAAKSLQKIDESIKSAQAASFTP